MLSFRSALLNWGTQIQSLLKSLARTFADEFIAQVETRAEKLGSSFRVMSAIFFFMPFVITGLVELRVPLMQTNTGQ